jgi:hypothetical protein
MSYTLVQAQEHVDRQTRVQLRVIVLWFLLVPERFLWNPEWFRGNPDPCGQQEVEILGFFA